MKAIFEQYGWEVLGCEPLNQGLINSTYSVNTTAGEYILQTVNHAIFKNPAAIDSTINAIGSFLKVQYPTYLFTHLQPTILGNTLIALNTGATINGRLLSQTAATLQSNTVNKPN